MRSAALRALLLAQLLLALVLGDDGSAARGAVATGEIVNLVGGEHLCPDGRGNLFPARHYRVFGGDEGVLSTREDCNAAVAQHLHDHAGQPCCAYDGFDRQRCCAEGACSAGAARTRAAHKNHFEKLMSPREDLAYVAIYKNGYRTLKTFLPRVERLFGSEAAAGEVRNYNSGSAEAVEAFQRLEAKRGVVFTFVRNPLERLLSAFNEINKRCWDQDGPDSKFHAHPFMREKEDILRRLELFTLHLQNFTLHGPQGHTPLCQRQHVPSQMEFLDFHASLSRDRTRLLPIKFGFIGRVRQIDHGAMDRVLQMAGRHNVTWQQVSRKDIGVQTSQYMRGIPKVSSDMLHKAGGRGARIIQAICEMFRQDFMCLDYAFPKACL